MNLFIYESICAGGFGDDPPASLRAEGWAMLAAVAEDFSRIVHVTTLLSAGSPRIANVRCEETTAREEPARYLELIDRNDAVIVIAPETAGVLEMRSRQVIERGRQLLGCEPTAIGLTADKLALALHWQQHRVPTPVTIRMESPPSSFPVVIKPRDGAGSQSTCLVEDGAGWARSVREPRESPDQEMIVQTYVPGQACSVAFLCGKGRAVALVPAAQTLSQDGRFQYQGGRLPLPSDLANRATAIATQAISQIDGLRGYIGVDVVLSDDGNDVAIEINPRLTTSYIGLRALCRDNLADAWLRIIYGDVLVPLRWRDEAISFCAGG